MRFGVRLAMVGSLLMVAPAFAESLDLGVKQVTRSYDPQTLQEVLQIALLPPDARLLEEFTAARIGKELSISVDGIALARPTVRERISSGTLQISGNGPDGEALPIAQIAERLEATGILTLSD